MRCRASPTSCRTCMDASSARSRRAAPDRSRCVLGQLGLDFATFKLEPLGVSMTDIGGLLHMTGHEIIIDSHRRRSRAMGTLQIQRHDRHRQCGESDVRPQVQREGRDRARQRPRRAARECQHRDEGAAQWRVGVRSRANRARHGVHPQRQRAAAGEHRRSCRAQRRRHIGCANAEDRSTRHRQCSPNMTINVKLQRRARHVGAIAGCERRVLHAGAAHHPQEAWGQERLAGRRGEHRARRIRVSRAAVRAFARHVRSSPEERTSTRCYSSARSTRFRRQVARRSTSTSRSTARCASLSSCSRATRSHRSRSRICSAISRSDSRRRRW